MQRSLFNSLWIAGVVPALVAQPVLAQVVQVTAVEVQPTNNGLEVILQTTTGKAPQVFTSSFGEPLRLLGTFSVEF